MVSSADRSRNVAARGPARGRAFQERHEPVPGAFGLGIPASHDPERPSPERDPAPYRSSRFLLRPATIELRRRWQPNGSSPLPHLVRVSSGTSQRGSCPVCRMTPLPALPRLHRFFPYRPQRGEPVHCNGGGKRRPGRGSPFQDRARQGCRARRPHGWGHAVPERGSPCAAAALATPSPHTRDSGSRARDAARAAIPRSLKR